MCFNDALMNIWYEPMEIAKGITFSLNVTLVWQYNSSGTYTSSSLYVNFRGVTHVFIPFVWKLVVPPRIHVFLWLLFNNKLMTRDTLKKRNIKMHEDCVYYSCVESIHHLFSEYIVARHIWAKASEFFNKTLEETLSHLLPYGWLEVN